MIRWCLYLCHHSGRTYEALRESGVISLPSQRTLRDYTHCVQASSGFSAEEDDRLSAAMKLVSCENHEKLVMLLLDEIHVRENLVFEKHEGSLIGFANVGDINTHLLAFENQVFEKEHSNAELSKTMMVFMVRRLFTNLQYPYVQFPVHSLTGDLLFDPFWEAVSRLERQGVKVQHSTCIVYVLMAGFMHMLCVIGSLVFIYIGAWGHFRWCYSQLQAGEDS